MGCGSSSVQNDAYRIILLGIGAVGKSTVTKQIRVLHSDQGFSAMERAGAKQFLLKDLVLTLDDYLNVYVESVVRTLESLVTGSLRGNNRNALSSAASSASSAYISSLKPHEISFMENCKVSTSLRGACQRLKVLITDNFGKFANEKVYDSIKTAVEVLWQDGDVKMIFLEKASGTEKVSLRYFLDSITKISHIGYEFTNDEMMKIRRESAGISVFPFVYKKQSMALIDCGGQEHMKAEREAEFRDLFAVFYMLSLDDYDISNLDDRTASKHSTRLQYSLKVFRSLAHDTRLDAFPFAVLLNKSDRFREKMESRDAAATLRRIFPSINVTDNDSPQEKFEAATKFIIDSLKKEKRNSQTLYYITNATDAELVKGIFSDIIHDIQSKSIGAMM